MIIPNHKILGRSFLEILYRSLNTITNVMVYTITGGAFKRIHQQQATTILNRITKINLGWHIWKVYKYVGTYAIGASNEQRGLDGIVSQEVAQLRTYIGLLAQQFASIGEEKVNVVGARGKSSIHEEFNSYKKSKYLD